MNAHNEQQWPEYLMLRDTGLSDDAGGLGQRIYTTAGAGYEKQKYVRADLASQPSSVVKQNLTTQPAAAQEAVAWVPPSFFDNGVVAATARRKPPSETAVAMRGEYVPLYAAPVAAASAEFDRARETPRRRRAVELLMSMGYRWHGGEWIESSTTAAPAMLNLANGVQLPLTADEAGYRIDPAYAQERTPAAPGIDLRELSELLRIWQCNFDSGVRPDEEDEPEDAALWDRIDRIRQQADASPKGGSERGHFQDRLADIEGRPRTEREPEDDEEGCLHEFVAFRSDCIHCGKAYVPPQAGDAEVQP